MWKPKGSSAKFASQCDRACLAIMAKNKGRRRLTLKVLAREMGVSQSTAARTVNRLFERKLVKKPEARQ